MLAWRAARTGVQLPSPPAFVSEAQRQKQAVIPGEGGESFLILVYFSLTSATRSKAVTDRQDWHERTRRRRRRKQSDRRCMGLSSLRDQQGVGHRNRSRAAADDVQYPLARHESHSATCRTAP